MHNCLSLDFQNMQKQPLFYSDISALILRRSYAMRTNRRQVYQVILKVGCVSYVGVFSFTLNIP